MKPSAPPTAWPRPNRPASPPPTTATSHRPAAIAAAALRTPRAPEASRRPSLTQLSGRPSTRAHDDGSPAAPPGPGQSAATPSTSPGSSPASAIAPRTASWARSSEVRCGSRRPCSVAYTPTTATSGSGIGRPVELAGQPRLVPREVSAVTLDEDALGPGQLCAAGLEAEHGADVPPAAHLALPPGPRREWLLDGHRLDEGH